MRRTPLVALTALVAFALTACSSDDPATPPADAVTTGDETDGTDTGATDGTDTGATDGTDAGPTDGTDAGGTDAGETDGTDAGGTDSTDAGGTDGTDTGGTPQFVYGPADVVTDKVYDRMIIEVDYMTGRKPSQNIQNRLMERMNALVDGGYLGKPGGIELILDDELPAPPNPGKQTFQELRDLSKVHRSIVPGAGEMSVYVLYVNGGYQDDQGNQRVLGFAYGGSWIVMLQDNIEFSCDNAVGGILLGDSLCNLAGASVLIHEMGHLFGLVNNGTPMVEDHQDEEHGKHDINEDCIMYWLNEQSAMTDALADRLGGGNDSIPPFDAECLADLQAAQQ